MKNNSKKKRIIFVAAMFAIGLALAIMIIANFKNNIVFFYTPSELQNPQVIAKTTKKLIRVGGLVKKNSIQRINNLQIKFTITDLNQDLIVIYSGILPNMFKEGQGAVAKGKFDSASHEFVASELLVKHDEKYMPPEVARSLGKARK